MSESDDDNTHLVLFNNFPGITESFTYKESESRLKSVFPLLKDEILDFCYPIKLQRSSHNSLKLYATNWALRGLFDDPLPNDAIFRNFVIPLKTIVKMEKEGGDKIKFGKFGVKLYFSSGGHLVFPLPSVEGARASFIRRVEQLKKSALHLDAQKWLPDPSWFVRLARVSGFDLISNDFCATYPPFCAIPKPIPSFFISESAKIRSRERFPIVSYVYSPHNDDDKIVLLRSAQPLNGLSKSKTTFEHEYLATVCGVHELVIVDCRPKKDAFAYQFVGKGYESTKEYKKFISDVSFKFLQIPHAYKVRKWYVDMLKGIFLDDRNALKKWSELIMQILDGASFAAHQMAALKKCVLVHCSDGWDRTSQIVALVQVMIDSRCRTVSGFCELVQKDWIDMGHVFSLRCGHVGSDDFGEASPIFAQFIDCVAQLQKKWPTQFEFNLTFLEIVLSAAYSQLFGDFLGNSYRQRAEIARPTSLFACFADEKYGLLGKIKNEEFAPTDEALIVRRDEAYTFFAELIGTPVFFSEKVPLLVGEAPPIPRSDDEELRAVVEASMRRRSEDEKDGKIESGYYEASGKNEEDGKDDGGDNNNN